MKKTTFIIGIFTKGKLVENIREFYLPVNSVSILFIETLTGYLLKEMESKSVKLPDNHYLAFDYYGSGKAFH